MPTGTRSTRAAASAASRITKGTILIASLTACVLVSNASAQLARVSSPRLVDAGDPIIGGDAIWLLRENDRGWLYTPLNGMPASFQVRDLPLYFEGILRYDILHTFPAPILQLRVLVTP